MLFPGTFALPALSVMLEVYDTARRQGVRSGKRSKAEEADHRNHSRCIDSPRYRLVVSLLAGGARCRQVLRCAAEPGLQHRLWHLVPGSGVATTPEPASEIPV